MSTTKKLCPDCGTTYPSSVSECPNCGLIVEYIGTDTSFAPTSFQVLFMGSLAATAIGVLSVGINLAVQILSHTTTAGVFTTFDCIVAPLSVGVLSAFFWRRHRLRASDMACGALFCAGYAAAASAALFSEGGLCLLMATPLLFVLLYVGIVIGKGLFQTNRKQLNMSLVPLFLLMLLSDAVSPHTYRAHESDSIIVHAPASSVFQYTAGYPPITKPDNYWLWNIGLPQPVQSVSNQPWVGGRRVCLLTQGTVLQERISQLTPGEKLTFDVLHQSGNLELVRHLIVHRGQFDLTQNPDGTTTLTGTTWYELRVFPGWYFNLWANDVVSHVHLDVMHHIARLAEADVLKHSMAHSVP